ncbi:hypothetical protein C8R46DRAFT_1319111 [Mycena filopes]|nr:hypothetical protein C8R46DRAFT_1319111 [Mycena filopes]
MADCTHKCPNCSTVFRDSDSKAVSSPLKPSLVPREILDTDTVPHEAQILSIRDFISRARAYMEALEPRLALLQSSLDQLAQEKHELAQEIRKHEGSISLIRSMPTGILSTIFAFTVSLSWVETAPWTVSAVSARWRATVISQPTFWTSIVLSAMDYRDLPNLLRLEQQLLRSGKLPLDIEVSALWAPRGKTRSLYKFLPPLCANAGRWGRLSISGSSLLYSRLGILVKEPLALLRDLDLEVNFENEEEDIIAASVDIFHNAPLLERVAVNRALWSYPLTMRLPWSQITRFGGSSSWAGHLRSLSVAANLVECTLEIQGTGNPPETTILLPQLLRLSLPRAAFLECLETPALLELYSDYAPPLLTFLQRNRCKLHTLFVWACETPAADSDIAGILDAVSTVTHLGLDMELTAEFVAEFCSSDRAQALECISSYSGAEAEDVDDEDLDILDEFAKGVESRRENGRLKSVRFLAKWLPPTILDRMNVLQAQGMELGVFKFRERFYEGVIPSRFQISSEE